MLLCLVIPHSTLEADGAVVGTNLVLSSAIGGSDGGWDQVQFNQQQQTASCQQNIHPAYIVTIPWSRPSRRPLELNLRLTPNKDTGMYVHTRTPQQNKIVNN
jgi:hypothetical protein